MFNFLLITPLLYIGIYILFKAVSLETKSSTYRERLENVATNYYLSAFGIIFFLIGIMIFLATWIGLSTYIGIPMNLLPTPVIIFITRERRGSRIPRPSGWG